MEQQAAEAMLARMVYLSGELGFLRPVVRGGGSEKVHAINAEYAGLRQAALIAMTQDRPAAARVGGKKRVRMFTITISVTVCDNNEFRSRASESITASASVIRENILWYSMTEELARKVMDIAEQKQADQLEGPPCAKSNPD